MVAPADARLGPGDLAVLRAAWSLGWATPAALGGLALPGAAPAAVAARLRALCGAGWLVGVRLHTGPPGHRALYRPGPRARLVDPGLVDAWRPPLAAAEHTVAVGQALLAAQRPGFGGALRVLAWQGEGALRSWAEPGTPFPDARVDWAAADRRGGWLLEVDRGTEGRATWSAKLARYLARAPSGAAGTPTLPIAITPGVRRARLLAELGCELGASLCAVERDRWEAGGDPTVFLAPAHRRVTLSEASLAGAGGRGGHPAAVT